MKRCSSCQFVNQDAAKFCSQCGAGFPVTAPNPTIAAPAYVPPPPAAMLANAPGMGVPPRRRNFAAVYIAASLLLLVGAAFAFSKAGLLNFKGKPADTGLVRAEASNDTGLLRTTAHPDSGVIQQSTTPPPTDSPMPNDVREYLEHVRRTEERRHDVSNRQLSTAMTLFVKLQGMGTIDPSAMLSDDPNAEIKPPTDDLRKETAQMRTEWKELSQFFLSKRAPSECVALQSHYDTAVGETSSQILDLMDILTNQDADPQALIAKLNAKKGQSKVIDAEGRAANEQVIDICRKYKVKPWFEISDDIGGSGGLLKSLGL